MSAKEVAENLACLLEDSDEDGLVKVLSFEDVLMMTRDEGFVIRYDDGSEYQVAVVKSA